jgi:hypothetical protein
MTIKFAATIESPEDQYLINLASKLVYEDDGGEYPMKDLDVLRWLALNYVHSHKTTEKYVYGDKANADWLARGAAQ